ncbi:MAG TPA: DUF4097 family beta strand repeat-containing protein [Chloroflexota bacterium]|nr:DUF4097 family beta strand repeat-containing protein [Chloroflexota bacterium]
MSTGYVPGHERSPEDAGVDNSSHRDGNDSGRLLVALILIALGIFFLIANVVPIGGGALFLALGLAFAVARMVTRTYGLAIPAGVLLGFGAFVALSEANVLPGDEGGWFFILLGAGFLAVYLIGLRPLVVWPFFPAAALIIFGLLILGRITLAPLGAYAWLANYWPIILVVIGIWLLVRDAIPARPRQALQILGTIALVVYGTLAILAAMNVTVGGASFGIGPALSAPLTEVRNLSSPLGPGDTLRVINQGGGNTTVRPTGGAEVRATAITGRWQQNQTVDIAFEPGAGELVLRVSRPDGVIGIIRSPTVDLTIEVPGDAPVDVTSSSGNVDLRDLRGAILAQGSSGNVTVANATAPVTVQTSSGRITLENVTGDLNVTSSSGRIQGSQLARVQNVITSSGGATLAGVFDGATRIQTSSGDVTLRGEPESSARVEVVTSSGSIHVRNLELSDRRDEQRRLSGVLGDGEGTLSIQTSSGDVTLDSTP